MSIAALLARARAELAAVETFAAGDVVENDEAIVGRVAFVEDGWVHWVDELGTVRASRPHAVKKRP